jgi:KaiC/GvpD/RAD55 family RecA-like ATPase/DNA-binding transcriptional ArsR family regulator
VKFDLWKSLQAFENEVRVETVRLLLQFEMLSLTDIAQKLEQAHGWKMTLPGVLKHLKILEDAGIVRQESGIYLESPDARKTIYLVEGEERVQEILRQLGNAVDNLIRAGIVFHRTAELARKIQSTSRLSKDDIDRLEALLTQCESDGVSAHLTEDEKKKIKLWKMMLRMSASTQEQAATKVMRVPTGYTGFDDLLVGGIPKGYTVLLMSPSCDERELLIRKFLDTGVKKDEATFYITIDPGELRTFAEEFPTGFYLFICNPQADNIIKSLPNVFKLKGVQNLNDINIALASAFSRLGRTPRRACFEILSDILLQHGAIQTRRWLTSLIPELRSKGFTTLVVMDPGMHSPQEVRAVLDLFEGEVSICEKETERGSEKFLKIRKMHNQRYSESELRLEKEKLK